MLGNLRAIGRIASTALLATSSSRLSHLALTASEPRAASLYRATVESVHDVTGTDIRLLRMRAHEAVPEDAAPQPSHQTHEAFSYAAGQWVDFHIPGVDIIGGYSIISAPQPMPPSSSLALNSAALPFFDLAVKKARYLPRKSLPHLVFVTICCRHATRLPPGFTACSALVERSLQFVRAATSRWLPLFHLSIMSATSPVKCHQDQSQLLLPSLTSC